jgi:hypothetical protein
LPKANSSNEQNGGGRISLPQIGGQVNTSGIKKAQNIHRLLGRIFLNNISRT